MVDDSIESVNLDEKKKRTNRIAEMEELLLQPSLNVNPYFNSAENKIKISKYRREKNLKKLSKYELEVKLNKIMQHFFDAHSKNSNFEVESLKTSSKFEDSNQIPPLIANKIKRYIEARVKKIENENSIGIFGDRRKGLESRSQSSGCFSTTDRNLLMDEIFNLLMSEKSKAKGESQISSNSTNENLSDRHTGNVKNCFNGTPVESETMDDLILKDIDKLSKSFSGSGNQISLFNNKSNERLLSTKITKKGDFSHTSSKKSLLLQQIPENLPVRKVMVKRIKEIEDGFKSTGDVKTTTSERIPSSNISRLISREPSTHITIVKDTEDKAEADLTSITEELSEPEVHQVESNDYYNRNSEGTDTDSTPPPSKFDDNFILSKRSSYDDGKSKSIKNYCLFCGKTLEYSRENSRKFKNFNIEGEMCKNCCVLRAHLNKLKELPSIGSLRPSSSQRNEGGQGLEKEKLDSKRIKNDKLTIDDAKNSETEKLRIRNIESENEKDKRLEIQNLQSDKEDGAISKPISHMTKTRNKTGIQDHPERDSLDGNLPGSSHGTGNPPPPPTPPSNHNSGNNQNNSNNNSSDNNNDDQTVNNNPDGESPTPGSNFSKGPNAKSKKHKRLKNETSTLDFPSKDKDQKKRPSYDSSKSRDIESGGFRPKTEPYTYLWVVLSQMYGKLIILLMLAFCLTEVLDNQIAPLTFQEVFLLYLYIGSIIAIMCIYVTVIVDNCPSITASKENLTKGDDPEVGSITSFGTLRRAHISRSKTSRTSFYLRVGALVFGLGTLIYNGLEIAMHSSIPEGCISDTILAHPIMQALFTFLQMHFLFVNSEVIVEKFGQIARFGFMHLVATNLALWVRMVVWESANDSMVIMKEKGFDERGGAAAVGFHTLELQRLTNCYQNNTLGQLWSDSQQYLFPFIVQYSLIAASVTYVMWCNVGREKLRKLSNGKAISEVSSTIEKRIKEHWKVDCRSASKGLFLGLLVLVGGIVILIIFFVMKDQIDFRENLFWMRNGTMMIILSLSIIATIFGFIQIPKLSVSTTQPMDLDRLLLSITIVGVYIFSIFGMIVGGIEYDNSEKLASFCTNTLLLVQVSLQGMLVAEASRRTCANRFQMATKPGRQVITFLLFSNVTLWILDTFMTHNSITHQFQIEFYGKVVWGVISRIALPLMILFRFHSAVILVEIWKNTYRTKTD